MKRTMTVAFMVIACCLTTSAAFADNILGRLGVTGRIGFLVPADSESTSGPTRDISTDTGFVGGGGFIYGLTRNLALEMDITHTEFDGNIGGNGIGSFATTNISLGAQYRFNDPAPKLTPYVGAGLDFLINDFSPSNGSSADVDTVVGVHLSGGVDYFVTRQLALTGEAKMVLAPDADIHVGGNKVGNYDPMNFSMTFGARYFFN